MARHRGRRARTWRRRFALLPAAIGYVDDQLSDLPRDGRIDDGKEVERETATILVEAPRAFFAANDDAGASEVKAAYVARLADAWTTAFTTPPPPAVRAARTAVEARQRPRRRRRPEASPRRGSRTAVRPSRLCVLVDEDKNARA